MPPEAEAAAPVVAETPAAAPAPAPELSGDALMEAALKELVAPAEESTEEATKTEEAKVEKPPEPKEVLPDETELSKSWAAYKRKMNGLKADREAFAEKQKQSDARQAELDKRQAALDEIETQGKTNPVAALERLGYTKDQVLEFLASDGKIPAEVLLKNATAEQQKKLDAQQKKLEAIDAEIKKRDEAAAAAQRLEQTRGIERQMGESMVDILLNERAKYPTLFKVAKKAGPDSLKMVLDKMAAHYSNTKNVLAISDAMIQVEQALKAHAAIFVDEQSPAGKADPRQAGAVEPANPGNIEPIPAKSASVRGVLQKKPVEELTDDEAMELATAQLKGAAE